MDPLTPTDDIIGPIVHQLARVLSTNIPSLGRMYEEPPDGPPEPGSMIFPVTRFKFEETDAIGKQYVRLNFAIRYVMRRGRFQDNIADAYKYFSAISRVLSAWPTQSLTDPDTNTSYAIEVTPKDGTVTQFSMSGQTYVALIISTEVLTEFNLFTS